MRRWLSVITGAVLVVMLWQVPGQAVILNHFVPGVPNMHDFFLPPEELGQVAYQQYNVRYETDTLRDAHGKKIDRINFTGPLGNPRSVDLSLDIEQTFLIPTFVWAPKWEVLGGRYGAYIAIPVGNPSIGAQIETARGRGLSGDTDVWDIGDIFVQPLWFMWTFPREGRRPTIDIAAGYGFDAPTGRYKAGAADNVGFGFWEHQLQLPLRFTLDEKTHTSFVLTQTVEIPHEQEDTDITGGAHYTMNWGFGRHFFDDWFEASLLGYNVFQVTDDHGSGVRAGTKDDQDRLFAVGTQIGIPKFGLAFKYYREFGAVDRFEGDMYTLTFALPLELLAKRIVGE